MRTLFRSPFPNSPLSITCMCVRVCTRAWHAISLSQINLNVLDLEGGHQSGCQQQRRGKREAKKSGRSSEATPTKTTIKNTLTCRRKRAEKEEERAWSWNRKARFSLSKCYFLSNSIKPPSWPPPSPPGQWWRSQAGGWRPGQMHSPWGQYRKPPPTLTPTQDPKPRPRLGGVALISGVRVRCLLYEHPLGRETVRAP